MSSSVSRTVSRIHFIECIGNRARPSHKTVQETHGLRVAPSGRACRCPVAQGSWRERGAPGLSRKARRGEGRIDHPCEKAMDDCIGAVLRPNGETVRRSKASRFGLWFRLRGNFINQVLRRIKVVDRYYMTYDDYGQTLIRSPKSPRRSPDWTEIGHHVSVRRSAAARPGFYEISGLAWSGGAAVHSVDVSTDGGRTWTVAELRSPPYRWRIPDLASTGTGTVKECVLMSRGTDELGTVQPTRADVAKYWNKPLDDKLRIQGSDNSVQPWRVSSDGSVHNGLS